MLKFLRIICIWICCAFCLLERIQLPAATAAIAAPFEYFDDHDQLSYDLDTEQSKAKYDTRLLSQQMLKLEKSTERYESADSHANGIGNSATNSELDEDTESDADADVDDLQPHERAASCHNNGHKYTHGQKVPRIDPCEVCLCMDGEIFCWWELCSKKPGSQIPAEYHANPQYDTSTVRLNTLSSTSGSTVQPTVDIGKLQQQYPDPRPHGNTFDLSAPKHEHITESSKSKQQQQMQDKTITSSTVTGGTKPSARATKAWQKKKTYQQQQKQKHEQQKQHQHKHAHEHAAYYAYPPSSSVSASKILSFPENLPSVLYHDYRTEEHQHHQHQHHQQHLKHQQKKLQLLMQQQQQKRKQQMLQHTHGPRKSGEGQSPQYHHDIFAVKEAAASAYASAPPLYTGRDSSNSELSADWGLVGGNENIYDDIETDSDILPEPPTKKPKMTAAEATTNAVELATTTTTTTTDNTTASQTQLAGVAAGERVDIAAAGGVAGGVQAAGHVGVQQSDSLIVGNDKSLKMDAAVASSLSPSSSSPTYFTSTAISAAVVNAATPAYAASNQITDNTAELRRQDVFNRESSEEDQDDAFHRWLTSTEINANNSNNKNNTNSYSDYNNNSLELESATPARRTDLLGLAGTQTINATTATKAINGTKAPKRADGGGGGRNNNNSKIDNVYFRSSYNDYSSEYNGSVVNIDILLTTADEQQQAQQQLQQHKADLITQSSNNSQQATRGGETAASSNNSSAILAISATTVLPNAGVQTRRPERKCNVMGTLYKIGDVLPQDTGNCLQCVCIDGPTSDDPPRVTCSPHNCPPLVLPDLFDATGY